MKAITHWLPNNDVYFFSEILQKHSLDVIFELILLNDFTDHKYILLLSLRLSSNNTIYFFAACPCRKNRIKKINPLCNMKHYLTRKQMLIIHYGLVKDICCDLIFNTCLKGLHWEVIELVHVRRIFNAIYWPSHCNFIFFLGLYFLLSLCFCCFDFGLRNLGHQLWTTVNIQYNYNY